ncbi:stealth conserved region 3 domain-containing protein [Paeniglutamicibacter sp. NPDC012692]|uniref:stealth family protein n=1 Tax=Paeniglutamicibacter sp. NPDC012692 TaxID=3364388 RepID=UPI0036C563B8
MSRWKGNLARLVPDWKWRLLVDLTNRRTQTAHLSLEEIKRREFVRYSQVLAKSAAQVFEREQGAYISPADSKPLRMQLEAMGAVVLPIDRQAVSPNIISTWTVASKELVGRRRDLAEAFGVRLFETHDGLKPFQPNVLDFVDPIDMVYTWVDGTDPDWIAKRDRHVDSKEDNALPTAASDARFVSNDELRYSLRSAEAFLPWVNHIYLVTAGQRPEWLVADHPKLTVVSHEEIFRDPQNLPTFNSHAIESQLHHIEGLSEHFLYMNDDLFFGKSMHQNSFYSAQGFSVFSTSERSYKTDIKNNLPINLAAKNNAKLIEETFGLKATLKFKHVAHPQRKSLLSTIERNHPEQVAQTAAAKFRSSSDLSIPSSLAHYYGSAVGSAIGKDVSYSYVDLGAKNAQMNLVKLCWGERPQMFCLNQVSGTKEDLMRQNAALEHFLEYAFPWKSSFEV